MLILGVSNNDASKICEGAYLAKTCTRCNPRDDIIDQATTATSKQTLRGSTFFGSTPNACLMCKVPLHFLPPDSGTSGRLPDVPTSARRPSDIPTLALPVPDIPASRRRREAHSREVQIIRKWQHLMLEDNVHAEYFMPPQLPQPPPQPMPLPTDDDAHTTRHVCITGAHNLLLACWGQGGKVLPTPQRPKLPRGAAEKRRGCLATRHIGLDRSGSV